MCVCEIEYLCVLRARLFSISAKRRDASEDAGGSVDVSATAKFRLFYVESTRLTSLEVVPACERLTRESSRMCPVARGEGKGANPNVHSNARTIFHPVPASVSTSPRGFILFIYDAASEMRN